MNDQTPRFIAVQPFFGNRAEESAADMRRLARETFVDSVAMVCTIVPEGDPAVDKAAALAPMFADVKARLAGSGLKTGILLQATMGHGWTPDSASPWRRIVARDGSSPYVFCPLGRDFLAYIRRQVATLAAERPDFVMIDDDARLVSGWKGCFCPLHLEEMRRRTGREWTRETLAAATDSDPELLRTYDKLLEDSVSGLVSAVREEMDRVNPRMQGIFCTCGWEIRHAARHAATIAAPGQRRVVRINNARYDKDRVRDLPYWLHGFGWEMAQVEPGTLMLAEADTCPHNRYSTSVATYHCQLAMSLLEGCGGAKTWITGCAQWEPASGEAYRRHLAEWRGFYGELLRLRPRWEGVRIPYSALPRLVVNHSNPDPDWGSAMFGRFGIPYANASDAREVSALVASDVANLEDAELEAVLHGKVLLDGSGAAALAARGFAEMTGVRPREWKLPSPSFERTPEFDVERMARALDLSDRDPSCETLSELRHRASGLSGDGESVAPGSVLFRNAAGGTVVTMAMLLPGREHGLQDYYAWNETRKKQILSLLDRLAPLDARGGVCHPGDAEILLRSGTAAGGSRVWVALDFGFDPLDELTLAVSEMPESVERLQPDGSWRAVEIRAASGANAAGRGAIPITLLTAVRPFYPAVFKIGRTA